MDGQTRGSLHNFQRTRTTGISKKQETTSETNTFLKPCVPFCGLQLRVCEAVVERKGRNKLFPIPLAPLRSIVAVYFIIFRNQSRMFGAKITKS